MHCHHLGDLEEHVATSPLLPPSGGWWITSTRLCQARENPKNVQQTLRDLVYDIAGLLVGRFIVMLALHFFLKSSP